MLNIVLGSLAILFALIVFLQGDSWQVLMQAMRGINEMRGYGSSTLFLVFLALHAILVAVPTIIAGVGLLHYAPWSRDLAAVCGVLQLAGFPVGTALGLCNLWAATSDVGDIYFRNGLSEIRHERN